MDITLAQNLACWAKGCPERIQLLRDWQTAALMDIQAGNGQAVQSTTANGVSITFQTNSATVSEWFNTLTKALEILDNPNSGQRKSILIFR